MVAPARRGSQEDAELSLPDPYELVSLRSVPAPDGSADSSWHRYEIRQGDNRIVGYRAGCIGNVETAVEAIVRQLNERRRHTRGRVQVVLPTGPGAAVPAAQR